MERQIELETPRVTNQKNSTTEPNNDKTLNININAALENKNNFNCCIYPIKRKRKNKHGPATPKIQGIDNNKDSRPTIEESEDV